MRFSCTPTSEGRERDEQAAVLVVGGEEVGGDRLDLAGARAELELLAEPPHAPFERERDRAAAVREAVEPERLDDVLAHQLALAVAGQLEDAAARGEDPPARGRTRRGRRRRRVVVVEQLEEEAEAAPLARDRLARETLPAVVVDRAVLAVRADEVRHRVSVATEAQIQRFQRKNTSWPIVVTTITAHENA